MIIFIHRRLFLHQRLLKLLVCISIVLFSCTGKTTTIVEKPKRAEEPIISYAKRLRIEKVDGYSQVSVLNPWQGAREIAQKWYLIPGGETIPSFIDSSQRLIVHRFKIQS